MNVFTPEALKRSNFKPCRLDEVNSKDHDGVYVFVFPSPNPINEINGDGDLIEIEGWATDYSQMWHERGTINTTPATTVYYKAIKDELLNGSNPKADAELAAALNCKLTDEIPPVVLGNPGYETDASGKPIDRLPQGEPFRKLYKEMNIQEQGCFRQGMIYASLTALKHKAYTAHTSIISEVHTLRGEA